MTLRIRFLTCLTLAGACGEDPDASHTSDHVHTAEDGRVPESPTHEAGLPDSLDAGSQGGAEHDAMGLPERPTFAQVYDILLTHCAPCHVGSDLGGFGFDSPESAYEQLIDAPATALACDDGTRVRVIPGDAAASLLVDKLREVPACGERMPMNADPLPADEMAMISAWIESGAPRD